MTDPKLTQLLITQQRLVENAQQALADLDAAMREHGPGSLITAYFQERHDEAHKALVGSMADAVDCMDSQLAPYPDLGVFIGTPTPPQVPPQELATTQWVRDYVAKQSAPWSATNLAITVLSGVLGGLIVILVGAVLLLLLP